MKIYLTVTMMLLLLTSNVVFSGSKIGIALPSWEGGQYIAYHIGNHIETKLGREDKE